MNRVVIGIGSNIDPYRHIERALDCLAKEHRLIRSSSLSVTAPLGFAAQADFVNGAALIGTDLDINRFTRYLKDLEQRLGRVKTENKSGPRTIDLDIVVWNGTVVDDDYYKRDFLRKTVDEIRKPDSRRPFSVPAASWKRQR
ncbi:MAG: 2-amino-4-hydroxy-6-hydroxymethyldihydropteridine diphosphokinase [Chitinispirillaceae bacterium]|nr:2-amino-4-hydroxy-6-hydroxymethyldihydropteridine diphosphokinase [Chitinispirillaceae bacterium]